MRITDADGLRLTAFATNIADIPIAEPLRLRLFPAAAQPITTGVQD